MRGEKHVNMTISFVTGGAGFIGSHLVDYLISKGEKIIVIDKLTYAGDINNLNDAKATGNLTFIRQDICDGNKFFNLLEQYNPKHIYHLAAESHVDNSIANSTAFIETNIVGTHALLNACLKYWQANQNPDFRFIHVSTDEVFGCLNENDPAFDENTPYAPNSPYSASKAASDHLAHAWHKTYGLPVIIANCSNNFGPRQHDEKLIPTIIRNAMQGNPIPIYGDGRNIRDWLYVAEHCAGLYLAANKGKLGEHYCFGADNEQRNLELAEIICQKLDKIKPRKDGVSYAKQLTFVEDRKGHDWRYAINSQKAQNELGYQPRNNFEQNLETVISYYLAKI